MDKRNRVVVIRNENIRFIDVYGHGEVINPKIDKRGKTSVLLDDGSVIRVNTSNLVMEDSFTRYKQDKEVRKTPLSEYEVDINETR